MSMNRSKTSGNDGEGIPRRTFLKGVAAAAGAATLGGMVMVSSGSTRATMEPGGSPVTATSSGLRA
jgi:hypothetical protein